MIAAMKTAKSALNEAEALFQHAIQLMTKEQIGQWAGCREWLEGSNVLAQSELAIAIEAAEQAEPVARVEGYYGGRVVISYINPAAVYPVGMALYAAPRTPSDEEIDAAAVEVATLDTVEPKHNDIWECDFVQKFFGKE